MVKNVWVQPQTAVQQFVANEYVSSCGDSGTTYLFTCDAGGGESGSVYLETNGKPGLQTGRGGDSYLSGYYACGTTHEAKSTDAFLDGYYVIEHLILPDEVTPVIVWRGPNNDNTHCTTNLDQDSWEIARS